MNSSQYYSPFCCRHSSNRLLLVVKNWIIINNNDIQYSNNVQVAIAQNTDLHSSTPIIIILHGTNITNQFSSISDDELVGHLETIDLAKQPYYLLSSPPIPVVIDITERYQEK